jgi:nicotinamide-nucleotide amidase
VLTGPATGYWPGVQPESTIEERLRPPDDDHEELAAEVSELAREHGVTVAVAESLTGGNVATALAAAEGASRWFRGSLVAYSSEVKYEVLGVPEGPVVSPEAAEAMAVGVRGLLRADVAVAVTGAGGPEPQDEQPPGTVFLAMDDGSTPRVQGLVVDGKPQEVLVAAAGAALEMLVACLRERA